MGFLDKLFGRKKKKETAAVEEPVVTEEKKEAEEAPAEEPKRETEAPKPEIVPEVPVAPTEPAAPEAPLQPIIPDLGEEASEPLPEVPEKPDPQPDKGTEEKPAPEVIPVTEPELTPGAEPEKEPKEQAEVQSTVSEEVSEATSETEAEAETEVEAVPEPETVAEPEEPKTPEEPAEPEKPVEPEEDAPLTGEEKKKEKKSFWSRVKAGLSKTKNALFGQINDLLKNFVKVDEDLLEELEELLICADVGVNASEEIIEELREQIKDGRLKEKEQVMGALQGILERMIGEGEDLKLETVPSVILVIGVNGVGKTTSIGKIANRLRKEGKKVIVAAADTFRAAAIDQLAVWCERAKVDLVRQNEGSDPAAVVFDACHAAKNKNADVLIIDTAGRLHNKTNLMNELAKINRVIDRELPGVSRENLLVLDATTGQNAIIQAKEFKNAAALTGLILNKLDGTAKGGIIISIRKELNIPVKFIGVGEKLDDMQEFDRTEFVRALFEG
ncbi:MAG TPA: signal recognition particle-docking protein FtsY [Clostridiales bacterium]|nr:signal recognition particle-docking protein FtsY [Clostridiales bacterium]